MSALVLLRGLTRESRHWGDFAALMRAQSGTLEVAALDLPGNGRLNAQASPASVAAMVTAYRAELHRRGLSPPYHLLAMSLGAMVALAWAAEHPGELRGCVLINTSVRRFSSWYQRLRPRNYTRLLGLLLSRSPSASEQTILELTTHHPPQPTETLLAQWTAWRLQNPVSRANVLRQLWAAARFHAPRDKPAVPLLVLVSAADTLVDPRCSLRLAQAWSAESRTHPSAGHDLPLDAAAWVAHEVGVWLEAHR